MIDACFATISNWPGKRTPPEERRKTSPFKMPYNRMLDLLEAELNRIEAVDIVIESGFNRFDIRNDGLPFAGRKPGDPGIILNFTGKQGPLRIPCDWFANYSNNLHAIALHLEHLRLAGIYGVGERGEQYKGWARLGSGAPIAMEAGMTVEKAAILLAPARYVRVIQNREAYRTAYRIAAGLLHPDNHGGDQAEWDALQCARAVLDAHHGIAKSAGGE